MASRITDTRLTRRGMLGTLTAFAAGVALVACGESSGSSAPATSAPAAAQPTATAASSGAVVLKPTPTEIPGIVGIPTPKSGQKVVKYWHNFGVGVAAEVHTKQINAFLTANPNYAVDVQYVPTTAGTQLSDKLVAAISGGDPPDT